MIETIIGATVILAAFLGYVYLRRKKRAIPKPEVIRDPDVPVKEFTTGGGPFDPSVGPLSKDSDS